MRKMYFIFGGGLGNQMFQYAYLYAQKAQNPQFHKTIIAVMHRNNEEDHREYALKPFNLSLKIDVLDENTMGIRFKLMYVLANYLPRILRKTGFLNHQEAILKIFGIIRSHSVYKFCEQLQITHGTKYVEGAFQSKKFFEFAEADIKKEFAITKKVSDKNKDIWKEIEETESVCIHIRLGDYKQTQYSKELDVCGISYYLRAIELIRSKVRNPRFFIFSNTHNDIEWIKINYRIQGDEFVYVDNGNCDYEDFQLMCQCKHFIISNSTYSWWAQYLGKYKEKIVAAPSKWNLREAENSKYIYEDSWFTVKI